MQPAYSIEIEKQMQEVFSRLSEKDKRLYAGVEALKFPYGGISYIAQLSLRDRSRVVPRSDSACVFTKRFLRSENAGFPKSRRVIARMMLNAPCWVFNE